MTPPSFHRLVDGYLTTRRGLGFDLETAEGFLRAFASHADRIGHDGPVTIELAVQWARSSRSSNPTQAVRRLAIVRQFARYCARFDPAIWTIFATRNRRLHPVESTTCGFSAEH